MQRHGKGKRHGLLWSEGRVGEIIKFNVAEEGKAEDAKEGHVKFLSRKMTSGG